jgi:hypothetical protein
VDFDLARRIAPKLTQTKCGLRECSSSSTMPKPVISVPQSIPKTRIKAVYSSQFSVVSWLRALRANAKKLGGPSADGFECECIAWDLRGGKWLRGASIPGPQRRGTGGTLSVGWKSHLDRGHPQLKTACIQRDAGRRLTVGIGLRPSRCRECRIA